MRSHPVRRLAVMAEFALRTLGGHGHAEMRRDHGVPPR